MRGAAEGGSQVEKIHIDRLNVGPCTQCDDCLTSGHCNIADDMEGAADRIREVRLRIRIMNLVTADRLTVLLNGKSLAGETCLRAFGQNTPHIAPRGQWLEFQLRDVRPVKGQNVLEISLDSRPEGLEGGVTVENVEVYVEYSPYPSGLNIAST